MSYDRYSKFRKNGTMDLVPFVPIRVKSTDKYDYYKKGETRLDLLSYQYYGDPNYDWLIMQANPDYGSLEYNITDGSLLRIPYPLDTSIVQYNSDIDTYKRLYGTN